MNRNKFLKATSAGLAAVLLPLRSAGGNKPGDISTYDRMREQVGFNHLPNNEETTMNTVLHRSNTRGHADHGWLNSHHSFSFAQYYNPDRMNFGVLRVLNDDIVAPGRGFGTHPHDNMEIISIPLEGDLEHKDSMGNVSVIREGDIQVMSAGTGIRHSEYNRSREEPVKFLQIWIFPRKKGVEPRYDQLSIREVARPNEFYQVLSPDPEDQGVWIHQDAWFHLGKFESGKSGTYKIRKSGNGIYLFVLEGEVEAAGKVLGKRDGLGVWDTDEITVAAESDASVLLMDVPMGSGE